MQDLTNSLNASLQSVTAETDSTRRIGEVRQTLNDYANAVHEPYGKLNMSPFDAYGELGKVLNAPRISWTRDVANLTREQVEQTGRDLQELLQSSRKRSGIRGYIHGETQVRPSILLMILKRYTMNHAPYWNRSRNSHDLEKQSRQSSVCPLCAS